MIKLLIADDEPLVCVGLQSMLKWDEYDIEIVGTARNGQQAAEMVEKLSPDIVITDIKMPLKSGLELAEECAEKYGAIPLFIILTSFEEFELVRRALGAQVVDYLVKLELTPQSLSAALNRAIAALSRLKNANTPALQVQRGNLQVQREKFFLRLYNNLFENEEQYLAQKEDLDIDFSFPAFQAATGVIEGPENGAMSGEKLLSLCASAVQMVRETLSKTYTCYVTTLDMRHFSITFCLNGEDPQIRRQHLDEALRRAAAIVYNYFSVQVRVAVGHVVDNPRRLGESYLTARRMFRDISAACPFLFFDSFPGEEVASEFAFSEIRSAIRRAFEEMDTAALYDVLTRIIDFFENHPSLRLQAMDAAVGVLHMAISLLPDGENTVAQIFADDPEGYRGIYGMVSTDAVVRWLSRLRDGCCELLSARRQSYKQQVVGNVQEYIRVNLSKRLSLNEVAAVFNFSPNYLSQLFAKYAGEGFVEYITSARIDAAKDMLSRGEGKVYEIAERLGFESAFYFSRVFKKVEGISPREFIRRQRGESFAESERERDSDDDA